MFLDPSQGPGLLHGIQVLALQILDEGDGHALMFVHGAHNAFDTVQACTLARPPASFPGHDFVFTWFVQGADQDGLDQPLGFDGSGQFVQGFLVKVVTGLVQVGRQGVHVQTDYFRLLFGFDNAALDEYI